MNFFHILGRLGRVGFLVYFVYLRFFIARMPCHHLFAGPCLPSLGWPVPVGCYFFFIICILFVVLLYARDVCYREASFLASFFPFLPPLFSVLFFFSIVIFCSMVITVLVFVTCKYLKIGSNE